MQNKYDSPVTQCEIGYVCNFYPTCNVRPYFAQGVKVKISTVHNKPSAAQG